RSRTCPRACETPTPSPLRQPRTEARSSPARTTPAEHGCACGSEYLLSRGRRALRGSGRAVLAREGEKRISFGAVRQPLIHVPEAEPMIEAACGVPVQDPEIEPAPAALDGDRREPRHEPSADAEFARPF